MAFIPGHWYLAYCTLTKPNPKEKFIICLTDSDYYRIFYINTNLRKFAEPLSQIPVTQDDLPHLTHKSYIDTSQELVCNDLTCVIVRNFGRLSDSIVNKIRVQVKESETMPPRCIQKILAEFKV